MTHYSLRILALPNPCLDGVLESPGLDTSVVQTLSSHAADCGAYGLNAWAEPRGHALYWVDNCWLRARVRGRDLPAFFAEVLKNAPTLNPAIEPGVEYLIEAEEY